MHTAIVAQMLGQSFHLLFRSSQNLVPRRECPDAVTTEVEDFFERHLDAIAEAMKEPDVVHSPHCRHGKRMWIFTWRWPFVITWISTSVCTCGINEILRGNRRMQHNIDDIIAILDGIRD
jgi:hypothetical protein